MNRKIGVIVGLILVVSVLAIVSALPTNWFEVAHVTGVIIQSGTNTVEATVNLGNIQSASEFSASESGTITVAEAGGLNTTMFTLSYPSAFDTTQFYNLYINVTIDQTKQFIPIIENGALAGSFPMAYPNYLYWAGWNTVYLSQGTHTITFDVYGKTQIVNQNSSIDFNCQIQLSP